MLHALCKWKTMLSVHLWPNGPRMAAIPLHKRTQTCLQSKYSQQSQFIPNRNTIMPLDVQHMSLTTNYKHNNPCQEFKAGPGLGSTLEKSSLSGLRRIPILTAELLVPCGPQRTKNPNTIPSSCVKRKQSLRRVLHNSIRHTSFQSLQIGVARSRIQSVFLLTIKPMRPWSKTG